MACIRCSTSYESHFECYERVKLRIESIFMDLRPIYIFNGVLVERTSLRELVDIQPNKISLNAVPLAGLQEQFSYVDFANSAP
jgi:hypothetical protein